MPKNRRKLNTTQAGWFKDPHLGQSQMVARALGRFVKKPMCRVSSGSQEGADETKPIYVHGARGTLWEEYQEGKGDDDTRGNIRWIDNLFYAFKEDIVEAPCDDDDKENEDKSGDTHIVLPKALPHQQQRKAGALFFNKRRTLTKTTQSIEDQVRKLAKTTETLTNDKEDGRPQRRRREVSKIRFAN